MREIFGDSNRLVRVRAIVGPGASALLGYSTSLRCRVNGTSRADVNLQIDSRGFGVGLDLNAEAVVFAIRCEWGFSAADAIFGRNVDAVFGAGIGAQSPERSISVCPERCDLPFPTEGPHLSIVPLGTWTSLVTRWTTLDKLISIVQEICAVACPEDGVKFLPKIGPRRTHSHEGEYLGFRVKVRPRSKAARINCRLTSGSGRRSPGHRRTCCTQVMLDAPAPNIRAYPARGGDRRKTFTPNGFSTANRNTRPMDFYDLYVLAKRFPSNHK